MDIDFTKIQDLLNFNVKSMSDEEYMTAPAHKKNNTMENTSFDPNAWANMNNSENNNEKKNTQVASSQVNYPQMDNGSSETEIRDLVEAIVGKCPGFSYDYN